MKRFIRRARLVREIVLLAATLLRVVQVVIEIVNKAVNCNHARQLRFHV